ncbi:MAG: hypothetical protein ACKPAD_02610, partial [Bacteroidota bacterium]
VAKLSIQVIAPDHSLTLRTPLGAGNHGMASTSRNGLRRKLGFGQKQADNKNENYAFFHLAFHYPIQM